MIIVFQSTHPRGVRPLFCYLYIAFHVFQSTHPRGVRQIPGLDCKLTEFVSIHAPTRGATGKGTRAYSRLTVSIHAPTRGATLMLRKMFTDLQFQSTHPRGVRHKSLTRYTNYGCFNPRTHEGCDRNNLGFTSYLNSFNPRTHEGCDCYLRNKRVISRMFQSTHPRGVRP